MVSWREYIELIVDTAEVCDFHTIDHQLISFNKQGTLCFNRGGMWHSKDEQEQRYKRVDVDSIIQKISDAGLESLIRSKQAFSIHSHHFLEYFDRLGILNTITYLAYTDPLVSLPIKYITKMSNLRCLIINPSKTVRFERTTAQQQAEYNASLEELVIQLPPPLEILLIAFPVFNGSLSNLPPALRILCIISNQFHQSLDYLPINLEVLLLLELSKYTLNIENLPVGLQMLAFDCEYECYTGALQIPPKIQYLQLNKCSITTLQNALGVENAIFDCGYRDLYTVERLSQLKSLIVSSYLYNILIAKKQTLEEPNIWKSIKIYNRDATHGSRIIEKLLM